MNKISYFFWAFSSMVFNSCNKKLISGCRLVFDAFNLISCSLFMSSNFVKLQLEIGFAV